jgi:hypothetical protein
VVERAGPVPQVHEGILHHILGGRRVVQDVDRGRERRGPVFAVRPLECLWIS